MKLNITIKKGALLVATSALGLWAVGASAATCTTDDTTFTVTTSPTDATCYDYGSGNVNGTVGGVELGGAPAGQWGGGWVVVTYDPLTVGSPDPSVWAIPSDSTRGDTLQIPVGYGVLDDTNQAGNPLEGALSFNFADGTFNINAASASAFLLVLKQRSSWAAFLLPAGVTTGSWNTDGKFDMEALSHAVVFGAGDSYLVPIPAAAWLLGSGLLGLFAVGRRRKSAQVVAA